MIVTYTETFFRQLTLLFPLSALTPEMMSDATSAHIANFTSDAVEGISANQLSAVPIEAFGGFTPEQISNLFSNNPAISESILSISFLNFSIHTPLTNRKSQKL